jgi:hypothetical protein
MFWPLSLSWVCPDQSWKKRGLRKDLKPRISREQIYQNITCGYRPYCVVTSSAWQYSQVPTLVSPSSMNQWNILNHWNSFKFSGWSKGCVFFIVAEWKRLFIGPQWKSERNLARCFRSSQEQYGVNLSSSKYLIVIKTRSGTVYVQKSSFLWICASKLERFSSWAVFLCPWSQKYQLFTTINVYVHKFDNIYTPFHRSLWFSS